MTRRLFSDEALLGEIESRKIATAVDLAHYFGASVAYVNRRVNYLRRHRQVETLLADGIYSVRINADRSLYSRE